jgi:hypothetical protein
MTFRTSGGAVNWASSTWPNPPAVDVTQWVYDQPVALFALAGGRLIAKEKESI